MHFQWITISGIFPDFSDAYIIFLQFVVKLDQVSHYIASKNCLENVDFTHFGKTFSWPTWAEMAPAKRAPVKPQERMSCPVR